MADGVIAVLPSTSGSAVDVDNSAFGSTTMRQRVVIGGDGSSGALINPATTAPSTAVYAIPVRIAANSTGNLIGSVYLDGGTTGYLLGYTLQSTGLASAAIDPRQVTVTAATSGAGLGTILSTGAGGAAIDPRVIRTITETVNVSLLTSPLSVQTNGGSAANLPTLATDYFQAQTTAYTSAADGSVLASTSNPLSRFGIQVTGASSAATSWDVRLEGSLDGTAYSQILQHTNVTGNGAVLWSGATLSPSLYVRSRCVAVVLGAGSTQINVTILGLG